MGIRITQANNTDRPGAAGKMILPVMKGLEYLNFFGGDAAIHTRNLAPGKSAAVMTGAIVAGANRARCNPASAYLTTAVTHTATDWTMMMIAAPVADTAPTPVIGNQNTVWHDGSGSGATPGVGLYFESVTSGDGNATPTFAVATDSGSGSVTGRSISAASRAIAAMPDCVIATYDDAAGIKKIRNMTTGASATAAAVVLKQALGAPLFIGHSGNPAYHSGQSDIYAVAIWKTLMSEDEIAAVYAWIQARMAGWYGVAV